MAYISLQKKVDKLTLNAGVSYQYFHRNITSKSAETEDSKSTQNISSFFPSASLIYRTNGNTFYISYNRTIEQPKFSSMNSGLIYSDSLTYFSGNPYLKSSITNTLSAGFNLRDFSFSFLYMHDKDPIVYVSETMEEGSDIVVEKEINFKSSNLTNLSVDYSKSFSKFNLYAEAGLMLPYGKYEFRGKKITAKTLTFNGNLNLSYQIVPAFGLIASFHYQGYRKDLTMTQKPVNDLTIGCVASFLNDLLTINASFTDVLDGANYNNLYYRYGNICNGTYGKNDQRGVIFKVSYKIFSKGIKTRSPRSNDAIVRRTM